MRRVNSWEGKEMPARRGDEGRGNDDDVAGYTEFALPATVPLFFGKGSKRVPTLLDENPRILGLP